MADKLYSVLLPTYNEIGNISIIIPMIIQYAEKGKYAIEIVVVDDSSPDGTGKAVEKLQSKYSCIKMLTRKEKMGLGSAYMDGLKLCSGKFVFLMDADFSHHPRYMAEFILKQEKTGADIVTGTRYAYNGGVCGWNAYRILTSKIGNFIAHFLLKPEASDLTGSFRLYKKDVLEKIMPLMKTRGYVFQMEAIVRAQYMGCKIEEVPIIFVDRVYGESKLGTNEIVQYLKGVWQIMRSL
jgi:dolichol-phosphate mannosyltransferase